MDVFGFIVAGVLIACVIGIVVITIVTRRRTGHFPREFASERRYSRVTTAVWVALLFHSILDFAFGREAARYLLVPIDMTLVMSVLVVTLAALRYCLEPYWDRRWAAWQSRFLIGLFFAVLALVLAIRACGYGLYLAWAGGVACIAVPYVVRYLAQDLKEVESPQREPASADQES